jgi:hypothetical protein
MPPRRWFDSHRSDAVLALAGLASLAAAVASLVIATLQGG